MAYTVPPLHACSTRGDGSGPPSAILRQATARTLRESFLSFFLSLVLILFLSVLSLKHTHEQSLGLSVEENIEYFRFWFCKNITDAEFKKRYEYNIQHMYGRRGAMKVHRAMNCSQIIQQTVFPPLPRSLSPSLLSAHCYTNTQPSAIDHHGCPFKTYDPINLRKLLTTYGLSEVAVADILEKARLHQYQSACCDEFVAHHPGIQRQSILHPNGYADAVLRYMRPDGEGGKRPGEGGAGDDAGKKAKLDK